MAPNAMKEKVREVKDAARLKDWPLAKKLCDEAILSLTESGREVPERLTLFQQKLHRKLAKSADLLPDDMNGPVSPERVFTSIFENGKWEREEVRAGSGSTIKGTAHIRPQLSRLISELGIKTLADASCGDGTWIYEITPQLDLYLGYDVVPAIIAGNLGRDLPLNHLYRVADISAQTLPKTDAILCRDCLVHLPLNLAVSAVRLFKASGSRYLIATTFPQRDANADITIGKWRPLNLQTAPFDLPEPMRILAERAPRPNDKWADKSLGVWDLKELPNL